VQHKSLVPLFAVVLIACMIAGCTPATAVPPTAVPPTEAPPPTPTPAPPTPTPVPFEALTEWDLVVLGDSSVSGLGEAYAKLIEEDLGVKVTLHDYPMAMSMGVILRALRGDSGGSFQRQKWPQLVGQDAEVVVLWGNPWDSVGEEAGAAVGTCVMALLQTASAPPVGCTAEAFAPYKADIGAIYDEIAKLRQGRPIIILGTDIYNPLVSTWREQGIDEACNACWEAMSTAARQAAEEHGVPFVSRYDALNGPNHDEDPRAKGFIDEDGEHPSEAGSQFTAELLLAAGFPYAELPGS